MQWWRQQQERGAPPQTRQERGAPPQTRQERGAPPRAQQQEQGAPQTQRERGAPPQAIFLWPIRQNIGRFVYRCFITFRFPNTVHR
ncbi:hypothetical protein JYU34_021898 [Plutella xylostella]|uniref:Uncharacterized protein n=1 Tax=Plutella xylostella TaxID=51655 RepID=A0ABQ7PRM0_PLUXY|nr:hypothetical protein JYU34_021898 [Plutella xylostella]